LTIKSLTRIRGIYIYRFPDCDLKLSIIIKYYIAHIIYNLIKWQFHLNNIGNSNDKSLSKSINHSPNPIIKKIKYSLNLNLYRNGDKVNTNHHSNRSFASVTLYFKFYLEKLN